MTPDAELFLSILSMDAYDQGYEPAVTDVGPSLGSATVLLLKSLGIDDAKQAQWASAGFSATAYRLTETIGDLPTGSVVISYRGTDSLQGRSGSLWGGKNPSDSDILNGYGLGIGLPTASQGALAIEFYNSVKAVYGAGNVVLTGHSLGGGLAGYVGALVGAKATLFDNMPFEAAAQRIQNIAKALYDNAVVTTDAESGITIYARDYYTSYIPYCELIYGDADPAAVALSGLKTVYVNGEFLGLSRKSQATPQSAMSIGSAVDLPGVDSGIFGGDLHSMSLLTIALYGKDRLSGWDAAAKYFMPALYSDEIAKLVGAESRIGRDRNGKLITSANDVMRDAIAYSAVAMAGNGAGSTAAPFGTSGIEALFDDAVQLGAGLASPNCSTALTQSAQAISNAFVQFSGQLALGKVLSSDGSNPTTGILTAVAGEGLLGVDLSADRWSIGRGTSGAPSKIGGRSQLIDTVLNDTVEVQSNGNPIRTISPAKLGMLRLWGDADYGRIEKLVFATTNEKQVVDLGGSAFTASSSDKSVFFLSGDRNDVIHGSANADMAYGGGGSDVLFGGQGKDILIGGDGNDTLVGGSEVGDEVNSSLDGRLDHSAWKDGVSDYLAGGIGYDTYLLYAGSPVDTLAVSTDSFHGYFKYSFYEKAKNVVDVINDSDGRGQIKFYCIAPTFSVDGGPYFYNDIGYIDIDPFPAMNSGLHIIGNIKGTDGRNLSQLWSAIIKTNNIDGTTKEDLVLISSKYIYTQYIVGVIEDFHQYDFGIVVDDSVDVFFEGSSSGDTINGTQGNDAIDGGQGNDTLIGGGGSDSYQIGAAGGDDTILDTGGDYDAVEFGDGVTADAITLTRSGANAENLVVTGGSTLDFSVTVKGQFAAGTQAIESFQFADGTTWSWQDIQNSLLSSSISGGADVIDGFATDDVISALGGDDTIRTHGGADTIDGGDGFDTVEFDGSAARYRITREVGEVRVLDTITGGTTVMTNVEAVRFREYPTTILLTEAPTLVAGNTGFSTDEDAALHLTVSNLLASVYDSEGITDSVVSVADAIGGTVSLDEQGAITFTPNQDFSGRASFSYTVANGVGRTSTGNVVVDVLPVNDAPVLATVLADQNGVSGTPLAFDVPANTFADVDGDVLTFSATLADGSALPSWVHIDASTGSFAGTPPLDWSGTLVLRITAADPAGAAASGEFALNVTTPTNTPSNHAPSLAALLPDQSGQEDTALAFSLPVAAFSDIDGDVLTRSAALVDGAALPSWLHFDAVTAGFAGTPPTNWNGALALVVTATDPSGATASGHFTLTIAPVNDAPVAEADIGRAGESETKIFDLVANDVDVDAGDVLTLASVAVESVAGLSGLTVSSAQQAFAVENGKLVFRPSTIFDPLDEGQTATVLLRYEVADSAGALSASTLTLTVDGALDSPLNAQFGTEGSDELYGAASDDYIDALGGDDVVYAGAGNDIVKGSGGDDTLYGDAGNDRLDGGAGSDLLFGGEGSDDYFWTSGDGLDAISDWGNAGDTDALHLAGVDLAHLDLARGGVNNADLVVTDTVSGETITVQGQFYGSGTGIESLVVGTTTLDTTAIAEQAWYRGGSGNDGFWGGDLSERFDGKGGDDTLVGGAGSDTYLYRAGDGNDSIGDYGAASDVDRLVFADLNRADVSFARSASDLWSAEIRVTSTGETIHIDHQFNGAEYGLEQIVFADGSTMSASDIAQASVFEGSTGTDYFYGTDLGETFDGKGGDDVLVGGAGSDTYLYRAGDGNDAISDYGAASDTDRLVFSGLNRSDVTFARAADDVWSGEVHVTSTGETIRIDHQFNGSEYGIEAFDFADGSLSAADVTLAAAFEGTSGTDYLYGTAASETFVGRLGDDVLVGGAGDDVYRYASGDGNDTIDDTDGTADRLVFSDLTASDVRLLIVGDDLQVDVLGTGQTITDTGHFTSATRGLDQIAFSDGTTWSRADIASHAVAA